MWIQLFMETKSTALNAYIKLMRAAASVTNRLHAHLSEHQLTVSQFGVLEALFHKGPMCQKEIGCKILKTGGNMTLVIDNLEKRGLVKRRRNPNDRRYIGVVLTDAGRGLIEKIFPRHIRIADDIFSVLDKDQIQTLGDLLKRLSDIDKQTTGGDHDNCSGSI
jgi:MarR family transcriptional regulator, 2-MHQ and catechol-resistance regulon repressor